MKIDIVLTACNMSNHYLSLFPLVIKVWKKKFNIDCYLILVADNIPTNLQQYQQQIILFKPIENIHTAFIAQVIRILYPALFENKNVMITDVDIFPISYDYFIKSIQNLADDMFITYRDKYLKQNMLAICYNVANSSTWKEIFQINNIQDIHQTIKLWYQPEYNGVKNCIGWFTDQKKLFEYVMKWNNLNRLIIFKDHEINFRRLDKKDRSYILKQITQVKKDISSGVYTDFHCIKPYVEYGNIIHSIVDSIC